MDMSIQRTAALIALLAPFAAAYGQATPWKIEMRQVREPTAAGDCGPIEVNVRDAEGKPPVTPDGKQIDWQDFEITLTQGAGPLTLKSNGRFLCATSPGATGVVTAKYPEPTYLTGNGKGRTGKRLIPGVTVSATLEVRSAGTAQAASPAGTPPQLSSTVIQSPRTPISTAGLPSPGMETTSATSQAGSPVGPAPIPVGSTMPATIKEPYSTITATMPSTPIMSTMATPKTEAVAAVAVAAPTTPQVPTEATSIPEVSPLPTSRLSLSTAQEPLTPPPCSVPVSSVTEISGVELRTTGDRVTLTWQPVPCNPVVYKAFRLTVSGGQTDPVQLPIQQAMDIKARSITLFADDTPALAGVMTANYRVDAILPDGRTVNSPLRMWDAGSTSDQPTEASPTVIKTSLDSTSTPGSQTGLSNAAANYPYPELWTAWLSPVEGAALVYWSGVSKAIDCSISWSDPQPAGRTYKFPVPCAVEGEGNEQGIGYWAANLAITSPPPFSLLLRITATYAGGTSRSIERTVTSADPPFMSFYLSRPSATELEGCIGFPYHSFNSTGQLDEENSQWWDFAARGYSFPDNPDYSIKALWRNYRVWATGLPPEGRHIPIQWPLPADGPCITWSYATGIGDRIRLEIAPADLSGVSSVPQTRRWITEWEIIEPSEELWSERATAKRLSSNYAGRGIP